ncbi:MAG: hypothetical protein Tsb0010_12020 [Parvularculaceae bacterium]
MEIDISLWAAVGFLFAAYAVVGNDALQTLGTFINSNRRLPIWALFLFASTILMLVFAYGYITDGGALRNPDGSVKPLCDFAVGCDTSFGRLDNTTKYPVFEPQWYHVIPPLALLILTRFGIPVSTTFMVLTIFATMGGLNSMLQKSLIGYVLAFVVGGAAYLAVAPTLEKFFARTTDQQHSPIWVLLQWSATGYLWAVWLMQDFANIFIFLPRGDGVTPGSGLNPSEAILAVGMIVLLLGYTFWNRGGPVQRILRAKTAVRDIRSATIIDFLFASLLFYFKELNNIPMSTTWVFLGLIAGREYAFALTSQRVTLSRAVQTTLSDVSKAFIGLVISIDLARMLPYVAKALTTENGFSAVPLTEIAPTTSAMWFLVIIHLMLAPIALYFAKRTKLRTATVAAVFAPASVAFLLIPIH